MTDDVAEQLGRRRRCAAGFPRPRVAAARGGAAEDGPAAAGLAGRPPRRPAGLRHRLLPDRGRDPGGRRLPALPRPRRRRLLRPDRGHRAARARAGPARRPGQGAGRDQRARDGVRRHPRLRRQPRRAGVAGGLLPAGRPRRPRQRRPRAHRRAAAGDRGPRHLGLLRLAGLPARGAGARRPSTRWPTHGAAVDRRPRDLRRPQPHPARDDAQGPRRRRRGPPGPGRLGVDRPASGPTTPTATSGWPRRASASRRRCWPTSTPTGAGCAFLREQLDDPEAAPTAGAATTAAGSTCRPRSAPRRSRRPRSGWPAPASRSSRARCGRPRLANLGLDLKGKIAAGAEEGRAVARLTDLGHGQALRALFAQGDDGPVPDAAGACRRRGARRLAAGARRDRLRRVGHPAHPRPRPRRGAVALPRRTRSARGSPSSTRRSARAAARPTPPSGWPR